MEPGEIIFQGKSKKGLDLIIRYPRIEDLSTLLDYINTLSKEKTFIRFQGEIVTLKEEKKYLRDFLEKIKKNLAVKLMVFSNAKLIGVADVTMQDKVFNHVGVFGIVIAKEFRGQGIGKLLMNLVLTEAKKNLKNLKIITLGYIEGNDLACRMYKKFGFVEYGNLPKGVLYKEEYRDHRLMFKNI